MRRMQEIWTLLKGMGSLYTQDPYCQVEDEEAADMDPSDMNLDEVTCARSIDLMTLLTVIGGLGFSCLTKLIEVITSPVFFKDTLRSDAIKMPTRRITVSPAKYRRHLIKLVQWGVTRTTLPEEIKFFSKYFATPKSTTLARAIFNGRRFSVEQCKTPPPVNIPDICTILRKMQTIASTGSPLVIVGDWRHFFHEIP